MQVQVTIVEAADRLMARALSTEMSAFFTGLHEHHGNEVLTDRQVERVDPRAVHLRDGSSLQTDTIILGVGVVPNTELARDAGLEVRDGIVVDADLLTSDASISAIGDCAFFPCSVTGAAHRLESVQNATDQARAVASRLSGDRVPYFAVPWFWSEQFGRRLQIAGVARDDDLVVARGTPGEEPFSFCRFTEGRLVALESVDAAADHMGARRLLASGAAAAVTPQQVADPTIALKLLAG
jgi:3-phenylpropionate/trans-cinnamate dioxygenase ferredoxin reductase component